MQKSDNTSGYLGVRRYSYKLTRGGRRYKLTKSYEATETRGRKTKSLGYFTTAEEAALFRAGMVEWGGVASSFSDEFFN